MRNLWRRADVPRAIVVAALLLLPLLATLQYRWIGQVSQAEREHLEADLRSSSMRFAEDFSRTLLRALLALEFQAFHDSGSSNEGPAPPDTRIYRDLYVAQGDSLEHWDPVAGRLVPAGWPAELEAFRRRNATPRARRLLPGLVLDESIPAVIAPRMRWRGMVSRGAPSEGPGAPAVVIAVLDLNYLRSTLAPELVRRHFSRSGVRDYEVELVSRSDPHNVIYASARGLPADFVSQADTVQGLLDPRPDARPPGPGFFRRTFGRFRHSAAGPGWELAVRHRMGSLEAVVNQARWRNLGIGFAILLLLGVGMAVLVIYTGRARRLARLQMEFVAGVSHEFRTPLAVICSAGDNLAHGVVASPEQVRRYGSVVRDEGRRLTAMVEQTLGFAGIQAGRMQFQFQPVEVHELVDQAIAACEPDIAEAGCEIETDIRPNLPPILGDATRLAQCLRNLLSNALKYGRESRWIGLRAEQASGEQGEEVRLTVEDRGPGIGREDLPHIFDPFYRGRNAVSAQIQGAGLGLSLVRHIVEAHGGKVEVRSTPGQGSRFTLHLPAAVQGAGQPA